jgi:hypothetical protein
VDTATKLAFFFADLSCELLRRALIAFSLICVPQNTQGDFRRADHRNGGPQKNAAAEGFFGGQLQTHE